MNLDELCMYDLCDEYEQRIRDLDAAKLTQVWAHWHVSTQPAVDNAQHLVDAAGAEIARRVQEVP